MVSLADAVGDRAIAVILSGTASDGAIGIRDVKNAGGITIVQTPDRPSTTACDDADVRPDQLQQIFDVLRPVTGVDFTHYKLPTIKRRLFRRMALHRLTEVPQYLQLLQSNTNEVRSLYQDLLIHVTRFFRDPDSFASLAAHVFPPLVERRAPDHPIRVWVSGCATGEEAYSPSRAAIA